MREPCEEGRDGKGREGTRPSLANEREATAGAVPGPWSRRMEKTGRTYNPFSKSHRPRDPATVVQKPRAGQGVRTARDPTSRAETGLGLPGSSRAGPGGGVLKGLPGQEHCSEILKSHGFCF